MSQASGGATCSLPAVPKRLSGYEAANTCTLLSSPALAAAAECAHPADPTAGAAAECHVAHGEGARDGKGSGDAEGVADAKVVADAQGNGDEPVAARATWRGGWGRWRG